MRSLSLADALTAADWRCRFVVERDTSSTTPALDASPHEVLEFSCGCDEEPAVMAARWPQGCHLLVVDHYRRDLRFEAATRPWAKRVMVIDDLANRCHDCDLLLDQDLGRKAADYDDLTPASCLRMVGPRYALLRTQFADARAAALARRHAADGVHRILISMGVSDPDDVTLTALKAVAHAQLDAAVDVVLGGGARSAAAVRELAATLPFEVKVHVNTDDMAALMAAADLSVGAAGTTTWERCCLGLPSIIVVAADNQATIAEAVGLAGAAVVAGRSRDVTVPGLARLVGTLSRNPQRLGRMARKAADICDGLGASRVAETIEQSFDWAGP